MNEENIKNEIKNKYEEWKQSKTAIYLKSKGLNEDDLFKQYLLNKSFWNETQILNGGF